MRARLAMLHSGGVVGGRLKGGVQQSKLRVDLAERL